MAGISAQTAIGLILSRIGGVPLRGASTAIVEGMPNAKQLGGGAFSFASLTAIKDSLNGLSTESIQAKTFQNPVAATSTSLETEISTEVANLRTTLGPILNTGTGEFTDGHLTLAQCNGLTLALDGTELSSTLNSGTGLYESSSTLVGGGIGDGLPALKDITDKMSGVKEPNYEVEGEFGYMQLTAVQSSYSTTYSQIPDDLDSEVGGVKADIASKLASVTKPLTLSSTLTNIQPSIDTMVATLGALTGAALDAKVIELTTSFETVASDVTNSPPEAKAAMTALMKASDASSYVSAVSSTVASNDTGLVGQTTTLVVKPEVITRIKADQAKYNQVA